MKDLQYLDISEIEKILSEMEKSPGYNTLPGQIRETPTSDDRTVSFTEKHTFYLKKHPKLNPEHYLANLRTMTRIRSST